MGVFDKFFKKPTPPAPPPPPAPITPPAPPPVKFQSQLIQPADLKVSDTGRAMVAHFEGCRLKAYQDVIGVWTIGYGQTKNVVKGMVWTQKQADDDLLATLTEFGNGVKKLITRPIDQNHFDALVSLAYNIGLGNFGKSTLLKLVNAGDFPAAQAQFIRWNRAGGQVVKGLTTRRLAEAAVFQANDESQAELMKIVNDIMMSP